MMAARSTRSGNVHGPFERLHAADGAAENEPETADAEGVEKARLGVDVVADGDERKIGAVDQAGFRIDGAGAGGTVAGAEKVNADDEVVFQGQHGAGSEDLRPPVADAGRT